MERLLKSFDRLNFNAEASRLIGGYLSSNSFNPLKIPGVYKSENNDLFITRDVSIEDEKETYTFSQLGRISGEFGPLNGYFYNMKLQCYTFNEVFNGLFITANLINKDGKKYSITLDNNKFKFFDGKFEVNHILNFTRDELQKAYDSNEIITFLISKIQDIISNSLNLSAFNNEYSAVTNSKDNDNNPYYLLSNVLKVDSDDLVIEVANYLKKNDYNCISSSDEKLVFQNDERTCVITKKTMFSVVIEEDGIILKEESPFIGKNVHTDTTVYVTDNGDVKFNSTEYIYNDINDKEPFYYYGRYQNKFDSSFNEFQFANFFLPSALIGVGLKNKTHENVSMCFDTMRKAGIDVYCRVNKIKNKNTTIFF